jgi:anti-sigma B factor antagonist
VAVAHTIRRFSIAFLRGAENIVTGIPAASGPTIVVALPAEIDVANADQVYDQLRAPFAAGAATVIADLTATTFCDSRGIDRIITAWSKAEAGGRQLRLAVSPGGEVANLMELLGIGEALTLYPSVDEAAR